ncbi:MAG: serine hydroxymethyltransferase [Myxococcota bacterium]
MTAHQHLDHVLATDPEVASLIQQEEARQARTIRLIPSENYASRAVMQATGSVMTNKYSEGYAGRRYYEGQEVIDALELLTIERAKALFGAEHANVQPYSGSPANLAAYYALLEPHDRILGMSLPHGGHLTHGWKVSATGRFYEAAQYPVDRETELLDFDAIRAIALEHKPKLIIAGTSAYPRIVHFDRFAEIAKEVGAYLLCDIAHISGLVAAGVHPSPVPVADVVTTTTHKTLRGPRGGLILCKAEHAKAIDRAVFPAYQGGPHNHTTTALAVALTEANQPAFKTYAAQVVANARAMGEALTSAGFRLVTGGTDNHLLLVDLTPRGVPGKPVAKALNAAGIVCNYNSIPFDPRKPFDPSGIRLGTPAITSRGMTEDHARQVGRWIDQVVQHLDDTNVLSRIAEEVAELCQQFPAPGLEHLTS